ncbi:hypothetical protein [Streptomyces sp. CCM_MD2014]|uniref:hypothetical protein n=1 Tax=Streptomyces sp. CCM_MD2014 TaxID=1561022 RepID=UPI00052A5A82|nr:hypothetical protein [Streptomyces sp. CCM_MD2014]AIV35579.1 hypothetical protein NI25_20470 [Streptomyces sp. CCM_MD2014]
MSAAHLHPVPDPDDAPATEAGTVPGEEAVVMELPAPEVREDTAPGEPAEDDDQEPGEEDGPRHALAVPDLRPYVKVDRQAVGELGALAADVTRSTGPRLGSALRPVWQLLRVGVRVLGLVLHGWFTGQLCPKVPPFWRLLAAPVFVLYSIGFAVAADPAASLLLIPGWLLVAVAVERWAVVKASRDAKAKASAKAGKGAAKEGRKASGKTSPPSFAARLVKARERTSAEAPAEASPEPAAEAGKGPAEEAPEDQEEPPVQEDPPAPSRDQIVRALHALVGGSSGVLDTALRDRLRYPSTRAVREALDAAGIPHREGVRAVGGNGPGVHRLDFPPLPPSQEGPPGDGVVAGHDANNNANNTGEGSGKGSAVEGNEYPFDVVPDPERGPTFWRVVPHDQHQTAARPGPQGPARAPGRPPRAGRKRTGRADHPDH